MSADIHIYMYTMYMYHVWIDSVSIVSSCNLFGEKRTRLYGRVRCISFSITGFVCDLKGKTKPGSWNEVFVSPPPLALAAMLVTNSQCSESFASRNTYCTGRIERTNLQRCVEFDAVPLGFVTRDVGDHLIAQRRRVESAPFTEQRQHDELHEACNDTKENTCSSSA